jgi:hypothetical protein
MKEKDDGVFFSSIKRKKNIGKKNVEKGGSLPLLSHFYIWDEVLLLPCPLHLPQALCLTSLRSLCYSSLGAPLSSGDGVNRK